MFRKPFHDETLRREYPRYSIVENRLGHLRWDLRSQEWDERTKKKNRQMPVQKRSGQRMPKIWHGTLSITQQSTNDARYKYPYKTKCYTFNPAAELQIAFKAKQICFHRLQLFQRDIRRDAS